MIFVFDIILLVPNTISKSLYVSIKKCIFVAENLWKSATPLRIIYENPQYKQINTWCMIERICHIDNELEDSIFLFGARQTWKSTFLRQSIPYVCIYFSLWVLRFPTSIYNKLSIMECCHRIIWQRQSFRIPCTCLYQDNETQIGAGSSILLFWYRCSQSFVAS